jgi:septum formation protein
MVTKSDVWLISHSPRRVQLLRDLGLKFRTGEAHVEESYPHSLPPEQIPVFLSQLKADNADVPMTDETLIITADTIVWAAGRVLGKPADEHEAREMLHLLSGKTHQVITGVTLRCKDGNRSFYEKTDVTFATLSDKDIDYYISHYRPFDKAGAYGIQEWIGMVGVEKIDGCFYNVMGLPVHRLYKEICCLFCED